MEETQRIREATPALTARIRPQEAHYPGCSPRRLPADTHHVSAGLVAGAAQGMRGTLATLISQASLLRDGSLGGLSEPQAEAIGRMQEMGAELLRRLEDLQVWTALESDVLELVRETVELPELLETLRRRLAPAIEAKGHQFQISLSAPPLVLVGDRARLEQALGHLFDNAVRYTPDGGRISLLGQRQGDRAVLELRDTGGGLPSPVLERLFDADRQAHYQLRRRSGGAGLGLGLAQRLIAAHLGRLEASPILNGTCFRVTLPLAQP